MSKKRLLLLSNSTTHGYGYLEHAKDMFKNFYKDIKKITFVPYAGVSFSYEDYHKKVSNFFNSIGYDVESLHQTNDPREMIESSEAIAVGGGNTFHLLKEMYDNSVIEPIRRKVSEGTPYSGWSAGSNMACPSIKTTNDMPIVEPQSFTALDLIPFQINPHFTDQKLQKHYGETRTQRLEEFIIANKNVTVLGLREGTALKIEGSEIELLGDKDAILLKYGADHKDLTKSDDFSFLLR